MAQDILKLQAKLLRDYYKDFSKYAKGKEPERKVAWVTSFAPVEILAALHIDYYYPESYAAVSAASGGEREFIEQSGQRFLTADCCSYASCFNGMLDLEKGPRGTPPKPDVLIAANNQCNTLPNWWNLLAQRYQVPLIVVDYPGEASTEAYSYVTEQHKSLISEMEKLSGGHLDEDCLKTMISNSTASIESWKRLIKWLCLKNVKPTVFFDGINFLITSRCRPETTELYERMAEAMHQEEDIASDEVPVFWVGYPLWYHQDRYFSDLMDGLYISGSNYITWWNLEFDGRDVYEQLFNAYNYTFLNLKQRSRDERLAKVIRQSGAKGAIVLHNKSCKCDFVSARNINIPQVEIEMDMIDRTYLNTERAKRQIDLLKGILCTE